ncbi:MAG: hypothetical protein HY821_06180 [Acidobacteria bacterium]|nr:hypothetical protein [Acidobacteriota bacterium]
MSHRIKSHTEERSREELASTQISPRTARTLSWCFVIIIFAVPLIEGGLELRKGMRPTVLGFFDPLTKSVGSMATPGGGGWKSPLKTILSSGYLRKYESSVEDHSVLRTRVQPAVQEWLHKRFGAGNNKIVVGKDGWLFYRSGVDYLVGPSVVDASYLWVRSKQSIDKQTNLDPAPDPRPAMDEFRQECARRGIKLLLLPIPDKSMMQGRELSPRLEGFSGRNVPNNRGYERLMTEMRDSGVEVLEVWKTGSHQPNSSQRYLRRDTHWLPSYMEEVARATAQEIRKRLPDTAGDWPVMTLRRERRSSFGDLVQLLRLTPEQQVYQEEAVDVDRVLVDGQDWQPDRQSEVLILGDSFTNIYSQPSLGWGASAGFAEHISHALGRPVDVIALNGAGASGTRRELARPENRDRLLCKKIVVWQFAIRDLSAENWSLVSIPSGPAACQKPAALESRNERPVQPGETQASANPPVGPLTLIGKVVKTSKVPEPYSAPYSDCLTSVLISVETVKSGRLAGKDLLVLFWAMKDNKWLPGATYAPGDRLQLELLPFKEVSDVRGVQRADDLDDFEHIPYFAIKETLVR